MAHTFSEILVGLSLSVLVLGLSSYIIWLINTGCNNKSSKDSAKTFAIIFLVSSILGILYYLSFLFNLHKKGELENVGKKVYQYAGSD